MPHKPLHWTRRARSILSSTADIVGDWFYFFYVLDLKDDRVNTDIFMPIVLGICVVSTIIGFISIVTVGCGRKRFCCGSAGEAGDSTKICCLTLTPFKFWHLIETIFEDIPQVAIAAYIAYQLRSFSPHAVFNLTTSGMNFFLDFLDIFEPHDEESPTVDGNGGGDPEDNNSAAKAY